MTASAGPCQGCGACCAFFRVSFYWGEASARGLPERWTRQLTAHHSCMAGTSQREPRCHALDGHVGRSVACVVYEQRPSPCREVQPGDEKCARARESHGLPALHPR
jgi:uncharacterized protein